MNKPTLRQRLTELIQFGMVGGLAYLVDVGIYNFLRFGPGDFLADKVLTAKVVSVAVAMTVSWLGNRFWTFRGEKKKTPAREILAFVVTNLIGMFIAVLCLWVSYYLLGFQSPLAENIAANGVGLILGMIFRYLAYKYWVFIPKEG